MVKLKHSEMRIIDDAFDMHGGYVLNFSDRTISHFFDDEFAIDFDDQKYLFNGGSKARRLRAFIEVEEAFNVSRVLRRLWEHKESYDAEAARDRNGKDVKTPLFNLLSRIEGGGAVASTDALEKFKADETLEELISAIERDIQADRPAAALDRLHTYCMKKFAHLIEKRGGTCSKDDPLQSRAGKYVKLLENERNLREISRRIIKSSISVFDQFNDVRNNESFAHDNTLIEKAEARFIFDGITAFLRFVKATEAEKFGV